MDRNEEIHSKGFDMMRTNEQNFSTESPLSYNKIKVGVKNLDDAIMDLGTLKKTFPYLPYGDKGMILKAIANKDSALLRLVSNFFYNSNGIYTRICNYFAFLYRYDWYIVPNINDSKAKTEKVLKDFNNLLNLFDNTHIKKICGEIALTVIKDGVYYGYIVEGNSTINLQQLPPEYCRSRFSVNGNPAVEFNMKFFDTFSDTTYRMKVLNLFPEEFKKGYVLYKKNKLKQDDVTLINTGYPKGYRRDPLIDGWYLLDNTKTVKFNFNGSDNPFFINAIPTLIDLDQAQDLDRRKQMQKLLKIIVQKLPLDKNGDLIFDIDEARDIHSNAVEMLSRAIGTDVMTTFADVEAIDMNDRNASAAQDDLEKVERQVFNATGLSQNLFNTDGNLSLEKSILNDESTVRNLLLQFEEFFDRIAFGKKTGSKQYHFNFYFLETTQYNYKEMAKLYKEQTQLGYSKLLPQIALGHSQSFILNSICFENDVLNLAEIMIPPMSTNTINGEQIMNRSKNKTGAGNTEEKTSGRPEKEESEKAEKTIQNQESLS